MSLRTKGWSRPSAAVKQLLIIYVCISSIAVTPSVGFSAQEESGFRFGFRERLRQTYLKNAFDLDGEGPDDWNFLRVRSQLWGSWRHAEGFKIYAQINNEHRHWLKSTRGYEDEDFEIDELIFENLYVSAERIAGSPFSIIAGRQNIRYGEGFLMMDGGPLDGSRTIYFNALRLKAEMDKRSLEFHILSNPSRDRYLPVVNCLHKNLVDRDETGAGIYYIDNSLEKKQIEGYYFYKSEEKTGGVRDDIHTFGSRLSGKYGDGGAYAAEFALQLGDMSGEDRMAMGGYAHSQYNLPFFMNPYVGAGLIYLSGDDPDTDKFEGWNPIYSRWPKWSELYIYTMASLGRGIAYWENLASADINLGLKPMDNLKIDTSLYYMTAPITESSNTSPVIEGGERRGLLSKLKISWNYTDYLSGHLLWERFYPGNYYIEEADQADFLRCELYFKY
ncbi:MAG: alginate export family protein [Candidatus Krumholzibacteriota bacterium]|nr:alginate export family protein [Candidatus Krumholzibacteriota bacterium]